MSRSRIRQEFGRSPSRTSEFWRIQLRCAHLNSCESSHDVSVGHVSHGTPADALEQSEASSPRLVSPPNSQFATSNLQFPRRSLSRDRHAIEQPSHLRDRFAHPNHYRSTDDAVSDVQLRHPIDRRNRSDIDVIQSVPSVQTHAGITDHLAGIRQSTQFVLYRGTSCQRIWPRVQLHRIDLQLRRRFDLIGFRVQEQTGRNSFSI